MELGADSPGTGFANPSHAKTNSNANSDTTPAGLHTEILEEPHY